jgi:2-polyprenyl-3-methyl-5-hydroxy-6-metoxy-1,4-benzoquinol methylase
MGLGLQASPSETSMNPYRAAFYQRQSQWHHYESPSKVREIHELRSRYYEWYTQGWLPADRTGPILDIGCGSGQFLYFLNKQQYKNIEGVDLDSKQIEIAQALGFKAEAVPVIDYLNRNQGGYEMIAMLDIIEHFSREELFPLMEAVVRSLRPGGRIIASVPNAESPMGLQCLYTDITHEIAFTPMSIEELLFCHDLKLAELRDPWPAPVGLKRGIYRSLVTGMRSLESLRLRSLGLKAPRIWSNVMWVLAIKQESKV